MKMPVGPLIYRVLSPTVAMVSLVYAMESMGGQHMQEGLTLLLLAIGSAALIFALRHFQRVQWPMIRLDAMQVPTFRVTMYGGRYFAHQ
jgi:uncharacterized membrane protein YidH (DUF202 family)